jgi:hypothetical protein
MADTDFPFFGGYNKHDNATFDCQDLVNLYMRFDPKAKKKFAYFNTPGLELELTLSGSSAMRELYVPPFDETKMFSVAGNTVYRHTTALTATSLGTIGTDEGYVSTASNNNNQIMFVDGEGLHLYDHTAGTLTAITGPGVPTLPLNVVSLDGYFVIPDAESRTYHISALNDGTKYDALDVAQIGAYGGINVGAGVVNRRLYFFKTDSTEVWYNAGAADFPFRRDNNVLFNFGCLTPASIVTANGETKSFLFWLARDKDGVGSVMMATGEAPIRISTTAIDDLIESLTAPTDLRCWAYRDNGQIFYVMNWTTDDITVVYDLTTSLAVEYPVWHRMEMEKHKGDPMDVNSSKTRHLADCHAYFNGQHYIGSYKAPKIYSYSRNYASNDGEPIKRQRTAPHFSAPGYNKIRIKKFQVDMQTGIGAVNGEYQNPRAYLAISRDGGRSFGNEIGVPIGKFGERKIEVKWWRKGIARDFVPRVTIYADVAPIVILGAAIDYEVLSR